MRESCKQNDNRNIVYCEKKISVCQIKEEKLLAKNKILPGATGNESVKAVSTDQSEKDAGNDFCRGILKEASYM